MRGIFFTLLLTFSPVTLAINGDMGTGTQPSTNGSETYPWLIEDLADFDAFAADPNYWAAGVQTKLMTNIDLSGRTYTTAVIAPDTSTSSGLQGITFSGVFDGNSNSICNLTITASTKDYIGLFGSLGGGSHMRDLAIVETNITGRNYVGRLVGTNGTSNSSGGTLIACYTNGLVSGTDYVGGLAGYNNKGAITNCYGTNVINGSNCVGGLVGWNYDSTLNNCYSTASINGASGTSYSLGGLVGMNDSGIIINCYSDGSVCGYTNIGGLVGESYHGSINSCHATGTIRATTTNYSYVGGLVGLNGSSITNCYSTCSVVGGHFTGGLVGYNNKGDIAGSYSTSLLNGYNNVGGLAGINDGGTVTQCYSIVSVSGRDDIGGLVGNNFYGIISCCYATGTVGGSFSVGGLVGENYRGKVVRSYSTGKATGLLSGGFCGSVDTGTGYQDIDNYWDVEVSEINTSMMGTGKTTAEMMTLATFVGAEWDFADADGDEADWMMLREGEDYPRLAWQEVYAGDIAGLYGVDIADFAEIARNWLEVGCPANCEQADIDTSGDVGITDLAALADDWMHGVAY